MRATKGFGGREAEVMIRKGEWKRKWKLLLGFGEWGEYGGNFGDYYQYSLLHSPSSTTK